MANIFFAAVLLSGILAVSGCAGLVPGLEALGAGGGGGYPSYGGAQAYPYDPGQGGGYAQPAQPYYQPQPYAYSGNPGVYYQPGPQTTQGDTAAPSGRWQDRHHQRQQDRIRQGQGSGHWAPREARRLHNEPEIRMRPHGNLNPQERARLNAMQQRGSQDINRLRHNGVQPGPTVQPRSTGPGRPTVQLRPAGQPRANGGRPARHDGSAR